MPWRSSGISSKRESGNSVAVYDLVTAFLFLLCVLPLLSAVCVVFRDQGSFLLLPKVGKGDLVVLLVGHHTCDSPVTGSSPVWAPSHSGFGQTSYTCVPLSPSSIIWYWLRGSDALWLGR